MVRLETLFTAFALSMLLGLVLAQSNSTAQVVGANYTQFDLFKNTGLSPCPVTSTHSTRDLEPRRSRGGGGGGGSYGGNGSVPLVKTASTRDQSSFCSLLLKNTSVAIMIPTAPTQTAFYPWWPTYLMQFVSLGITYAGLWWTWRGLKNSEERDMKLPVTFWIQLPFDIAREIAWFVKTVHGFLVPSRFAWVR
jgi:hypothetical protein